MAEIDLSRAHECSPERTKYAVEVWANLSGLLAFFVAKGRGLESPQDLRHVFVQLREGSMQLGVLCHVAETWILREIAEGRVNVTGAEMVNVAASGTVTAIEGVREAAELLYRALNIADQTFEHLDKRRVEAIEGAPRRRRIGK